MKLIVIITGILFLTICAVFVCPGQDKLRRVEQPAKFVYPNTPIQVVVKLDGKEMSNKEAQAGSDWLRKLSLEVTNTSSKDISWVSINLMLREPVYGAMIATPETAGIVIEFDLRYADPAIQVLPSGQKVVLKPPVSTVDRWLKYALKQGIEDIEKVILDVRQVGFTDDTAWTRGRISRKDPDSGHYVFVTEDSKTVRHPSTSILVPENLGFFLISD